MSLVATAAVMVCVFAKSLFIVNAGHNVFPVHPLLTMSYADKCIEALVVRGAILMSRFLQGEESDSFAWLNPSGYIDSVRERSGLRDWQATNREDNQAVVRRQAWRGLWATAAVATLTCGGILLYRKDREVRNTLSYLLQNLKLSTWRLRLF